MRKQQTLSEYIDHLEIIQEHHESKSMEAYGEYDQGFHDGITRAIRIIILNLKKMEG